MFHRKFILSITITRSKLSNPLFMLIRFFFIRAQFRFTWILSTLWSTSLLCLFHVYFILPFVYASSLSTRDISARRNTYRDLAVGNDSSPLLNNAPRATATTSFCNKSESHGVFVEEEDIFVGWDEHVRTRDDRLVKNGIGVKVTVELQKLQHLQREIVRRSFFLPFFFGLVGIKSYFHFYVSNDTSFVSRECACIYAFYNFIYYAHANFISNFDAFSFIYISWISTWWDTPIFFKI